MTDQLTQKLLTISKKCIDIVDDNITEFPEAEVRYTINVCSKYNYDKALDLHLKDDEEISDQSYVDIEQNKETRTEIPQEVKNSTVLSAIQEMEVYHNAVELINNQLPDESNQFIIEGFSAAGTESHGEVLLNRFIQVTTDKAIELGPEHVDEQERTTLVSSLVREVEQPKITYNTTVWLYGVGINFEELQITEDLSVSKVTCGDLESEIRIDAPLIMNLQLVPARPPTLKLTFECQCKNRSAVITEQNINISLLQLFTGNVGEVVGREVSSQSPLRINNHQWTEPERRDGVVSIIEQDDKQQLESFFEHVEEPFRQKIADSSETDYLNIAVDRYQNALVTQDSIESSIASSIMSLEALYLKENEQGELSERLAQRAGVLLGCLEYSPMEIYNRIKSGYSVRSSYVHGTRATEDFSSDLALRTIEYSSRSLILFLQLVRNYDKNQIISKIDNAIMSPQGRESFEELVASECGYKPSRDG